MRLNDDLLLEFPKISKALKNKTPLESSKQTNSTFLPLLFFRFLPLVQFSWSLFQSMSCKSSSKKSCQLFTFRQQMTSLLPSNSDESFSKDKGDKADKHRYMNRLTSYETLKSTTAIRSASSGGSSRGFLASIDESTFG